MTNPDIAGSNGEPYPVYGGVFSVAPTTFTEDGDLDLDSQRRVIDFLVDCGVGGICILANWSEQFSLTDSEKERLTHEILAHVSGRVPVIVTASNYSSRVAAERSRRAQAAGASMVMLMPPYHGATLHASENGIRDHFAAVADMIDLPIMVQDAPMSGTHLSPAFMARLAQEIPQVCYFKLEAGEAPDKLRELLRLGGESIVGPFDGEESITLLPDLDAGATGTMPGATFPEALVEVVALWQAGRRADAEARYERLVPLITFENRLGGLLTPKVLLKEGGIIASDHARAPYAPLSPSIRARLIEMARRVDPLVLRWAA
jgi:dihydrodipicolinate synthase/N-acetylneuraminate lyase